MNDPARVRNTSESAMSIMEMSDEKLQLIAARDPDMIRDVAAALIWERDRMFRAEPEQPHDKG